MWGMMAGALMAVAANGPRVYAAMDSPTIWWRTEGAQVVETHDDAGVRTCSLIMDRGGDAVVLRWRQNGATSIYVKHQGWQFGDHEGALPVQIQVGGVQLGTGAAGLDAVDYKDWIMAPVDQPVTEGLRVGDAIRVAFPDGRTTGISLPIDRGRIVAVVRAVQHCQQVIGFRQ